MAEGRSVTGSIRAKLVRRFAAVAIGAALAACSIGYAIIWVWSGTVGRDLTMRPPAGLDGKSPQPIVGVLLSQQLDEFLHERIIDVRGWASAPTVLHAAQQAHVLHEESGLLDVTAEAHENRPKVRASLGQFPIADGYLRAESARSEDFDWMRLTDRNGLDVVVTDVSSDFVHTDEDWWQRTWSDGVAIGEVAYDQKADSWAIDISMRIDDPATGEPVGVLMAALNVASLHGLTDRYRQRGYGERITVADHNGLLIAETASEHSSARLMNEKASLRKRENDARRAAFEGDRSGQVIEGGWTTEYSRTADGGFYADVARGSRFPGFNWVVIVENGRFGASSGINIMLEKVGASRRTYAGIFGVSFLVIALLAGVIVWWMTGRVSRPIRYLHAAAVQMSRGRMTDAVRLDTNDEFSEVADALERMRRTVQNAVRVLRERQ